MKKDERIKEITTKLEQGVKDLYTSDHYKEFLEVMSKFHNYSFNNCLLISMQKPNATLVAGYKAWQTKFKRQVRKGEDAIWILAPVPHKIKTEVEEDGEKVEKEIQWTSFRPCSVFDVSQTDGEDIPSICNKLNGEVDDYTDLIKQLERISPAGVIYKDIKDSANGYFNGMTNEIVIQEGMSQAQTVKTLIHEVAHSILHSQNGEESEAAVNMKEVQAESVAYTVCSWLGLDTSEYSFGYIAGWSIGQEAKELQASMEQIRKTAAKIIDDLAA